MDELKYLTRLVQDAEPSAKQIASARGSLLDHIDASQTRDQLLELVDPVPDHTITVPRWNAANTQKKPRAVMVRIAVAASVIAVAALAIVGIQNLPAADATLTNLARVVELLPNEAFTDVAVERQARAETLVIEPIDVTNPELGLVGVIIKTEETRRQSPDSIIQIETTITDVTFITSVDPEVQVDVADRVGVGTTETVTAVLPDNLGVDRQLLSSDADVVYQRLISGISADGDTSTPVAAQILDEIIALHTAYILTPSERVVTIEVLAMVDDLTVNTDGTTVTVSLEYVTETGREKLTAAFDPSGWLISQSLIFLDGIPGLTSDPVPVYRAEFTPPDVSG